MSTAFFQATDRLHGLDDKQLSETFAGFLESLGKRSRVLVIPPDASRAHSRAPLLLLTAYRYYGQSIKAVLPALGTHRPMTEAELTAFFPGIPLELFRPHRWKEDVLTLGEVPPDFVAQVSDGCCRFPWPAQVNKLLVEGNFDLILSLGQVVPHEVVGMANYSKNIFVGTGGRAGIDYSHWLGARWGIERTLGRIDTPVRAVLDYAQTHFAAKLPLVYAHTVVAGARVVGLFAGSDRHCFEAAAQLSAEVNIEHTGTPVETMVVWLDPGEFRSTWLGNKAIYRSRLAMADGGRLIILAPGVACFGEDGGIDRCIRAHGYHGTAKTEALVESGELSRQLAAAAHLIHGSSEGRFEICYAAGGIDPDSLRQVGYTSLDFEGALRQWNPASLQPGWNRLDGQDIYFIQNPALGLWTV